MRQNQRAAKIIIILTKSAHFDEAYSKFEAEVTAKREAYAQKRESAKKDDDSHIAVKDESDEANQDEKGSDESNSA